MILLFPPVLHKRRGKLGGQCSYVIDWVLIRVDDRVRRLVELFPDSQQALQLPQRVASQQRPVRRRRPQPQGRRPGLYSKVYGRARTRHKYPDCLVRDPTGARSNYSRGARDSRSCFGFELSESRFPVFGEYASDRLPRRSFDVAIEINERYVKAVGHRFSDR